MDPVIEALRARESERAARHARANAERLGETIEARDLALEAIVREHKAQTKELQTEVNKLKSEIEKLLKAKPSTAYELYPPKRPRQ